MKQVSNESPMHKIRSSLKPNLTQNVSIKNSFQSIKVDDRKKPSVMSNKKYETISDNIIQNNKKLNGLIDNYNRFLDKYENENFRKARVIENLQKEVEKLEESIYKPSKQNRVAPLLLDPNQSFEIDRPRGRYKESLEKRKRSPDIYKNTHKVNNTLNNNNDKLYQYLLLSNMVDDENPNKVTKKQVDEIRKIEKTVNQQHDFLAFLMDKNGPIAPKKSDFDTNDILDKLSTIQNQLTGGTQKRSKKLKNSTDNKMKEMHNFLNQNLLKNYQVLANITNKGAGKLQTPIFMPSPMLNTKI